MRAKAWIDGGINKEGAAIGVVIRGEDLEVLFQSKSSVVTCNEAEFSALIVALNICKTLQITELEIYSDSALLVKVMNSEYKLSAENLLYLNDIINPLLGEFSKVIFIWIPRKENSEADSLARKILNPAK